MSLRDSCHIDDDGEANDANDAPIPLSLCSEPFLKQLLQLSPSLIVYVSCNVHTQARDVGWFMEHSRKSKPNQNPGDAATSAKIAAAEVDINDYLYEIVSLRGADLFPQTHHVEGVCVLRKRS